MDREVLGPHKCSRDLSRGSRVMSARRASPRCPSLASEPRGAAGTVLHPHLGPQRGEPPRDRALGYPEPYVWAGQGRETPSCSLSHRNFPLGQISLAVNTRWRGCALLTGLHPRLLRVGPAQPRASSDAQGRCRPHREQEEGLLWAERRCWRCCRERRGGKWWGKEAARGLSVLETQKLLPMPFALQQLGALQTTGCLGCLPLREVWVLPPLSPAAVLVQEEGGSQTPP